MHCFVSLNSAFLVHFECIAIHLVNQWGVGAEVVQLDNHDLHRTIEKNGVANQVGLQRSGKFFFLK